MKIPHYQHYPAIFDVLGCLTGFRASYFKAEQRESFVLCYRGMRVSERGSLLAWRVESAVEAQEILETEGLYPPPHEDAIREIWQGVPCTLCESSSQCVEREHEVPQDTDYYSDLRCIGTLAWFCSMGIQEILRTEEIASHIAMRMNETSLRVLAWNAGSSSKDIRLTDQENKILAPNLIYFNRKDEVVISRLSEPLILI